MSIRILLLEDSPADARLIERALRKARLDVTTECVADRSAFERALRERAPDLILSDHGLPGFSGPEALRLTRQLAPALPFILVTGSLNEETAVEFMKAGAADYVLKDHLARLPQAVQRALREKRLHDERARAIAALHESEEQYRSLFEHTPYPVWVFDVETHGILAVNSAAIKHYGYTHEEFLALRIEDLRPAEDVPALQQYLANLPADYHMAGTWRHRKKDGSVIDVEVSGHSLTFAGRPAQFVVVHDVTDRTRAVEAVRDTAARLQGVMDNVADGVFTADERGIVESLNPAAERMFGYTAAQVVGGSFRTLMAEPFASEYDERLRKYLQTGIPTILGRVREVVGRKANGSSFAAELAVSEMWLGERRLFIATVRDLTERQRLEQQFRQAQKMEAVGRLAAGVAHDFNNLLTAILGSSELALADLPPEHAQRQDLMDIKQSAERAAVLTRQLLAFSRQQVLTPQVLSVNELIVNLEKLLRRLLGEDVTVRTALAPDVGRVRADPGQLEQVVVNLAVNARDAMPQGGRLTLETQNIDLDQDYPTDRDTIPAGLYVMLAVSDTGVGMDDSTKARLFEPFFTTKPVGKGTGLGLATVYGIVKQSGGYIWLYSELGNGTSFKIYLPRVAASGEAVASGAVPVASLSGSETILVVEDDEAVRHITCKALEARGYTVLAASDGAEALRLAAGHERRIDLLLTDVVMPDLGGRELAERLRAARPGLRALFLSGYTDDAILQHGVLGLGAAFLQKPYSLEGLARKVREVLEG